jgi:hypothetical protein
MQNKLVHEPAVTLMHAERKNEHGTPQSHRRVSAIFAEYP